MKRLQHTVVYNQHIDIRYHKQIYQHIIKQHDKHDHDLLAVARMAGDEEGERICHQKAYYRRDEREQKALEEKEFTAAAGGGAVEVTISGKKQVTKVKLSEEVVDPDDIEMLEDLIVAAVNEALRKVEEETSSSMAKLTGGLGGLGGFGF